MALTASQRLDVLAPQFAGHSAKDSFLAMADELVAPASSCGLPSERRSQAVALQAAHLMTLAYDPSYAGGASGGAVTSKREGDLSLSYGSAAGAAADDADLSQTTYGRQLLELVRRSFTFIGVTGGDDGLC